MARFRQIEAQDDHIYIYTVKICWQMQVFTSQILLPVKILPAEIIDL